jgi:nicotinate-nucleotide adenylyltransferase
MKTAIFGGTFDPVHSAHLEIARAAADHFQLDRVLFIPAGAPPHKRTGTPYRDRYAMVELACQADPRFISSRLEARTKVKSYTIDTLERIREERRALALEPLYLIIGADAFSEVESWYRWKDVIAAVEFIVVARPGHKIIGPAKAVIHPLESLALEVSSSEIRKQLTRGEMPKEVPKKVAEYIRAHKLYQPDELSGLVL